ncbi:MAG: EAL domain-containing protein [Candidatus Accumulibacter sp.]|uniref:EAL domain-containing protein n=1 Tax=Accumulibacter sp. TaxID=2053492 RepID=UPI001A444A9E|nr:EAL domain-containing protein [Accumulibacter sp.]MBL8393716.1 EAL domain-containing protein [Accumulibacter sp.]
MGGEEAFELLAGFVPGPVLLDVGATIIDQTGIRAHQLELELELELTTGILMEQDAGISETVALLRRMLPDHLLKLDQRLARGLPGSAADGAITAAIITMDRSFNLEVIAEGAENPAQADYLRRAKCDKLQGYLFSRPLPAENIGPLLRQDHIVLPARAPVNQILPYGNVLQRRTNTKQEEQRQ